MHIQHDLNATSETTLHAGGSRASRTLVALALATSLSVLIGCGQYDGGAGDALDGAASSGSGSGTGGSSGSGGTTQAESIQAFSQTVLPMLQTNCAECHSGAGPGSPSLAHSDATTAYFAVLNNQKANLGNPPSSRLAQRLAVDQHYCWDSCPQNGGDMAAMIAQWATIIGFDSNNVTVENAIRSGNGVLADGVQVDPALERYTNNAIALYQFDEGGGNFALDTSGISPPANLTVQGGEFLPSFGYRFEDEDAVAIASAARSRKLFDHIADPNTGSQQFSVEAWLTAANVSQEGPARIIGYSRGTGSRNFTLGQVLYNYNWRNRSLIPDGTNNGSPALQTYDDDRDLQATLQHVVMTYDQYRGRRIYVDSVWTDDEDEQGPARLFNWDPQHLLVVGNETSLNRPWQGTVHYLAVYKEALSQEQITQNFIAGVGLKVVVRFDTSMWVPGSYVEFLVSELDDASYLFCAPTFFGGSEVGTRVAGLRIAVNGIVPIGGQAFSNIDTGVFGLPQRLSRQCSVIRKDLGSDQDVFSIDFEILEGLTFLEDISYPPPAPDLTIAEETPDHGFRDFERINATMATLTGIDPTTSSIQDTFIEIQEQLPSTVDLRSFVTANQVGITKLALEYCDVMVEDGTARDAFFGAGFNFDQPTNVSFANQSDRDQIIDALYANMIGNNLATQPTRDTDPVSGAEGVHTTLDTVITNLINSCDASTPCDSVRTRTIVKGLCTAVLASGAVHIH